MKKDNSIVTLALLSEGWLRLPRLRKDSLTPSVITQAFLHLLAISKTTAPSNECKTEILVYYLDDVTPEVVLHVNSQTFLNLILESQCNI